MADCLAQDVESRSAAKVTFLSTDVLTKLSTSEVQRVSVALSSFHSLFFLSSYFLLFFFIADVCRPSKRTYGRLLCGRASHFTRGVAISLRKINPAFVALLSRTAIEVESE